MFIDTGFMNVNAAATAISRKKESYPARKLSEKWLGPATPTILDYGCGKGADVAFYNRLGFDAVGYDPGQFEFKQEPYANFSVVTCFYVLNVVEPEHRMDILKAAWSKVAPGGFLAVAARTRKEVDKLAVKGKWTRHQDGYITSKKTFQAGILETQLVMALQEFKDGDAVYHICHTDRFSGAILMKKVRS